jgi:chromate reductase, NAD(P)H dehydrogenase (quinone)
MRVLAISGSLRAGSHNTALLRAAASVAPEGVELELFDGLELVPPYNEDHDTDVPPEPVDLLRQRIAGADAVLFATPEYNGTVPGQLKNAIDWASRPFGRSALWGKPVAVIGASTSEYGALWAQADLRKTLGISGARVLDAELPVGKAQERLSADGELDDDETRERLVELLEQLADHHRHLALAA